MKSKIHSLFLCLFFGFTYTLYAQEAVEKVYTTGPQRGTLVVVGGGKLDHVILQRFIELAGGPAAAIVVIPTAGGKNKYDDNDGGAEQLRKYGATNVTVLHTKDRSIANSTEFVKPLLEAKAVWFSGGRQWRLVDAYKDTKTEKLLWEVLNRGGVIGGTSAGATIQGSYLARGDTKNNQIMMGDHEAGFSFIKNVAIDQHLLARNRQFDMFNILDKRPELLGIGLDESTAIIVTGDEFEVIGKSYIVVFDGSFWSREGSKLKNLPTANNLFYFLRPGDKYDMKERKVVIK